MSPKRTEHRILVIESSAAHRERLSAAFEKSGAKAHLEFASTPEAALEVIKRETIDVLFVNQAQYGLDAFEIVGSLQAIQRSVPIVMMTQRTDDETLHRSLRDGAYECVAADEAAFEAYPAVAERAIIRFEAARENTERERAILRSQKQWMSIIDAITDYIFVLDSDRILVKVNNSFAAAIGRHPRDIVGSRIDAFFDLDIPSESSLKTVLDDGTPLIYEKEFGDGIYQISIIPLRDGNRPLTVHVMKDITEVTRLKDQLYHSDKLASIGLLVSGVAHEINNPLTGTIAYTELLAMKVSDESIRAQLRKILDSAERCKKIVDNLLTFSRQHTPSKSLETINDIIDRTIDLRSYWLKSNNIQVIREYGVIPTVFVDVQEIQQVILNLLLNAEQAFVDAGHANATVLFVTQFDKTRSLITIRVIDNGPGIPQKVGAKIFEPFFTTKPIGIGTGLGLSISREIIEEHGGNIWFENVDSGGTAFVIELPAGTGNFAMDLNSPKINQGI